MPSRTRPVSGLSNSEFLTALTETINARFEGPSPIFFTEEQVLDIFEGDEVIEHLERVVDSFEAFVDEKEGTSLEVQMGQEDETKHPSEPNLDVSQIESKPYHFSTRSGADWAIVVYKNAVTLTALHGADIEDVDFDHAYTITIWAHVPA